MVTAVVQYDARFEALTTIVRHKSAHRIEWPKIKGRTTQQRIFPRQLCYGELINDGGGPYSILQIPYGIRYMPCCQT